MLSGTIQSYPELSKIGRKSIDSFEKLSGTIESYQELSETIRSYQSYPELSVAIQA